MKKVLCVDFDGTITNMDVGNRLFHNFSRNKDLTDSYVKKYREGEMTLTDLYTMEVFLMDNKIKEICDFIDSVSYDETFNDFVKRYKDIYDMYILSDGFDWYINRILKRMGIEDMKIYSNTMILEEDKTIITFPYMDEECHQCGNCKRNHIRRFRENYEEIIYIGDGISDFCASKEADVIYAKKGSYLDEKLKKEKFDYNVFDKFKEIEL